MITHQATCRQQSSGRCHIPKELMAFRIGQVVVHKDDPPGEERTRYTVVREWLRTATGEHMVYLRYRSKFKSLFHCRPIQEIMVVS